MMADPLDYEPPTTPRPTKPFLGWVSLTCAAMVLTVTIGGPVLRTAGWQGRLPWSDDGPFALTFVAGLVVAGLAVSQPETPTTPAVVALIVFVGPLVSCFANGMITGGPMP